MGAHTSAEAAAVLDAIRRIVRLLRQRERDVQTQTGLSGAQLFILHTLQVAGGALTPGEVSRYTLTHQSSVSGVVRRLTEAGLVRRTRSPIDARRVELSLTPAGRAAVRRAPRPVQQDLIGAVDLLPQPDRVALARGLSRLNRQLGIGPEPPPMLFEEGAEGAE
jgi:DNA-binding MarR family transcriptional regulator